MPTYSKILKIGFFLFFLFAVSYNASSFDIDIDFDDYTFNKNPDSIDIINYTIHTTSHLLETRTQAGYSIYAGIGGHKHLEVFNYSFADFWTTGYDTYLKQWKGIGDDDPSDPRAPFISIVFNSEISLSSQTNFSITGNRTVDGETDYYLIFYEGDVCELVVSSKPLSEMIASQIMKTMCGPSSATVQYHQYQESTAESGGIYFEDNIKSLYWKVNQSSNFNYANVSNVDSIAFGFSCKSSCPAGAMLDDFLIMNLLNESNALPSFNLTYDKEVCFSTGEDSVSFNITVDAFDDEGDQIYYGFTEGSAYNETYIDDFEREECLNLIFFKQCNLYNDYSGLKENSIYVNASCNINDKDGDIFSYNYYNPITIVGTDNKKHIAIALDSAVCPYEKTELYYKLPTAATYFDIQSFIYGIDDTDNFNVTVVSADLNPLIIFEIERLGNNIVGYNYNTTRTEIFNFSVIDSYLRIKFNTINNNVSKYDVQIMFSNSTIHTYTIETFADTTLLTADYIGYQVAEGSDILLERILMTSLDEKVWYGAGNYFTYEVDTTQNVFIGNVYVSDEPHIATDYTRDFFLVHIYPDEFCLSDRSIWISPNEAENVDLKEDFNILLIIRTIFQSNELKNMLVKHNLTKVFSSMMLIMFTLSFLYLLIKIQKAGLSLVLASLIPFILSFLFAQVVLVGVFIIFFAMGTALLVSREGI